MENRSLYLNKLTLMTLVSCGAFFLATCFVTTANIILFVNNMNLPEAVVRKNAPVVLVNIFAISFLFTIVAYVASYFTTMTHVRKILNFTEKVAEGNYKEILEIRHDVFDIHGYKAIMENLNKMVGELSSVETLRSDFISNASHELKTPLTVIQNYATLIQAPCISDQVRIDYSSQIVEQTTKLSSLVTNILKLNKLENQKIFADVQKTNVSELICECMVGYEQTWEKKGLNIEPEILDDIYLNTDRELLKIAVNNLISNAIKFTESRGTVGVKLERFGVTGAVIRVSDTGCGMDEKTEKHIFEKFYQGEKSHHVQGNGLGLALVKRIVDILGYEICVESEQGKGSTFTLTMR